MCRVDLLGRTPASANHRGTPHQPASQQPGLMRSHQANIYHSWCPWCWHSRGHQVIKPTWAVGQERAYRNREKLLSVWEKLVSLREVCLVVVCLSSAWAHQWMLCSRWWLTAWRTAAVMPQTMPVTARILPPTCNAWCLPPSPHHTPHTPMSSEPSWVCHTDGGSQHHQ